MSRAFGCVLWVALFAAAGRAAELQPGDVAVVAVNTGGSDDFAWVALRDLPAGTVLNFTDSSVSNGCFRWSEHFNVRGIPGPLTWSATGTVVAGSVVRFDGLNLEWSSGAIGGRVPDLSGSGDQLIVYSGMIASNGAFAAPWFGDPAVARMLFAVNIANSGWDNVTGGSTALSFVPPGLSAAGATALHLGSKANAYYAGPLRGTPEALRAAMAVPSNWVTSNSAFVSASWPAAFEVLRYPRGTLVNIQ